MKRVPRNCGWLDGWEWDRYTLRGDLKGGKRSFDGIKSICVRRGLSVDANEWFKMVEIVRLEYYYCQLF